MPPRVRRKRRDDGVGDFVAAEWPFGERHQPAVDANRRRCASDQQQIARIAATICSSHADSRPVSSSAARFWPAAELSSVTSASRSSVPLTMALSAAAR